jgi:hypothetical protein
MNARSDPDRDASGRFVAGNKASKGVTKGKGEYARGKKLAKNRYIAQMEQQVTPEDIAGIITKAIAQAKAGDRWARDFVFDYLVGRPVKRVLQLGDGESPLLDLWRSLGDDDADDVAMAGGGDQE